MRFASESLASRCEIMLISGGEVAMCLVLVEEDELEEANKFKDRPWIHNINRKKLNIGE